MPLTQSQIDSIYSELQAAIRVERASKKAKKIESDFYRKIVSAIESLNGEAQKLISADIDRYLRVKERVSQIENDFRTFYLLRHGKILRLALYEIQSEDLNGLLPVERDFLISVHNTLMDNMDKLLGRYREKKKPEEGTEKEKEKEEQPAEEEAPEKPQKKEKEKEKKEDYRLVRILEDQPPIAQQNKNYYLRKNDILYLTAKFAELLVKRKVALPINRSSAV